MVSNQFLTSRQLSINLYSTISSIYPLNTSAHHHYWAMISYEWVRVLGYELVKNDGRNLKDDEKRMSMMGMYVCMYVCMHEKP